MTFINIHLEAILVELFQVQLTELLQCLCNQCKAQEHVCNMKEHTNKEECKPSVFLSRRNLSLLTGSNKVGQREWIVKEQKYTTNSILKMYAQKIILCFQCIFQLNKFKTHLVEVRKIFKPSRGHGYIFIQIFEQNIWWSN